MDSGEPENVELVRAFVEAFTGLDFQRLRDTLDADRARAEESLARFGELHARLIDRNIEIDISGITNWKVFLPPDGRGRGIDTWGEFWRNWFDAWETNQVDHVGWESADDWVIHQTHNVLSGRSSGAPVEFDVFAVWRLRDGKVVGYSVHPTREAALAAARGALR